jgi:acylphosphatase
MSEPASVRAIVYGYVQGVLFRDFTLRRAKELGLAGYVRNLPSGTAVEVQAEGERKKLEKLIGQLKAGPPRAEVEKVEVSWSKYAGSYSHFSIRY